MKHTILMVLGALAISISAFAQSSPEIDRALAVAPPQLRDAATVIKCVMAHDASYMLYDGKSAYTPSDQQTPEKFAGKKVTVKGTLDTKTKTIHVESITAAK